MTSTQPLDLDRSAPTDPDLAHALPGRFAPPTVRRAGFENEWGTAAIAARIRRLVAQHDRGDVCAAARRLGVPVQQLIRVESVLDGEADDASATAAERLLSAVVLRYGVDAAWLLTGRAHPAPRELPPTLRLWLAELLRAVGERIVEEHRARTTHRAAASGGASPPA